MSDARRRFWEADCDAVNAERIADFAVANLTAATVNVKLAELALEGAQALARQRREEAEALRLRINEPDPVTP